MNKKFEYVDDNPGAYFGMLVENWGDYSENDVNVVIKKVEDTYVDENGIVSKDNYNKVSKYLDKNYPEIKDVVIDNLIDMYGKPSDESLKESVSKSDLYSALEYMYGFNKKEANDWIKKASNKMKQSVVDGWKGNAKKSALTDSLKEDKFVSRDEKIKAISSNPEARKMAQKLTDQGELSLDAIISFVYADFFGKEESLKEDKFVPQDKMSKKAQKELNDKKRGTWGNTNPVTRVQPNKKAYDRKRDKKTNLDEAKKGSKVYIAIGLEKGKEPKILGVYDSKEKANEQYKDSKMWVNISEQTVK